MKPLILLLLILQSIIFQLCLAQPPTGFDAAQNLANAPGSMFRSFDNRYQGVKGEPTIFAQFVEGTVNLTNGTVEKNQKLNFDSYTGELLVDHKKLKRIMIVSPNMVNSFTLIEPVNERELSFVKLKEDGKSVFYERLFEGKTSLYKKYGKKIDKAVIGGAYNTTGRNYDEFTDANKYFIKKGEGELVAVRPQKKDLEVFFSDRASQFKEYLRSKKPDLKNDRDPGRSLCIHG